MPYPPQGAGVASFLGLLDTPAAYTGEAQKVAKVNAAEDALEFGETVGGLEVLTEENFVLFNGVALTVWTDLQIADAGGNKPQGWALLEFDCAVAADRYWMVRIKGEVLDTSNFNYANAGETNNIGAAGNSRLGYALVPTDVNGVIEWRCNAAAATVLVTLRAFITGCKWPGTASVGYQLHTGNAPVVWTGITLGTGPCLALLRCVNNDAGFARECVFKRYGDDVTWAAAPNSNILGCNIGMSIASGVSYALVPTDSEGRIEWGSGVATDWTIYLLSYIKNVKMHDVEVYNATTLNKTLGAAYFQTIDLPLTSQSLVLLKEHGPGGFTFGVTLRQTGLLATWPYEDLGIQSAGPWPGYHLQLTNEYGQVDYITREAIAGHRAWLHCTLAR